MIESPMDEDTPAPKGALQWFILVAWSVVMTAWAWWWSLWAGLAAAEPNSTLHAGALFALAVGPAALAIWKYPTGWVFRAVFGAVAFLFPLYVVAFTLFGP